MKKIIYTIRRFCTYALIGITSLILVLSLNTSALTQIAKDSSAPNIPSAANFIWPTQGYISQGFRKYQHEGIDIAGPSGTPIVAVASGTVVKASWDNWGLGNAVEIKHLDGSITVYGHNRRLLVSKGQQVNQGQIIAEMGSTGNSSAPHLHFEIYPNGRIAADPSRLLVSTTAQITTPHPQQTVSPPPQISVNLAPVNVETKCTGFTIIQGETANNLIKVCENNGELFYVGQLKQDLSQPIKITARNIGQDKYRADNGSFSYLVSPQGVEVWRNGILLRTDIFNTSK
ncbi:M23 family metallopeptidase [Nostoc sp. CCY0012]|uniref:M23 family metallopeptidase n=1 Tax=Nostoc sp. CCY0012 TaxID=1056123 RepID=UPI0039C64CCA